MSKTAIDFGHWLANSPRKEKYSRAWIENKFKQFEKEMQDKTRTEKLPKEDD